MIGGRDSSTCNGYGIDWGSDFGYCGGRMLSPDCTS